jgi:hypothetical protein
LEKAIEMDARAEGVSVNGLITSVLTKYHDWDRIADRARFISIPESFLIGLLGLAKGDEMARIVAEVGPTCIRENMLVWFKKGDLSEFIAWISLYSKYSGLSVDVSTDETSTVVMKLVGHLEEKWSKFLATMITQTMESLYRINPKIQALNNLIVVTFQLPSGKKLRTSK